MPSWIPTSPSTGCDLLLSWRKVLHAGCPGLSPLPYNEPFLEEGHIFRVDWSEVLVGMVSLQPGPRLCGFMWQAAVVWL